MMTHSIEYKVGSKRYLLSKTELRCMDEVKPENNSTIPLNQVDPNYNFSVDNHTIFILMMFFFSAGFIYQAYRWIADGASFQFNLDGHGGLIFFGFFLVMGAYKIYQYTQSLHGYQFPSVIDGSVAFTIPVLPGKPKKTQAFIDALVKGIRQVTPSNANVLFMLEQYDLLTRVEWAQLDASIQQKKSDKNERKSVIVHLANQGK